MKPTLRKSPKKIVYLVDFFRIAHAGTEKQLLFLMKNLPEFGYRIFLISIQRSEFLENFTREYPNIQTFILDGKSDISKSLHVLIKLYFLFRKIRPDILHTYFPTSNSWGILIGRISKIPVLISSRRDMGFWQTNWDLFSTKIANHFLSHILVNSLAVKKHTISTENYPEKEITVIYNGLEQNVDLIDRQRFNKRKNIVCIVANLNRPVKRVDLFISAASEMLKSNRQVEFWIVGDGCLRNDLEKMSMDLGIADYVKFLGRRTDVKHILNKVQVGVICSDSEGFSNAIMEYMIAGLPVVATQVGGNPELVRDKMNGLLVPPDDHLELAAALMKLLQDKSLIVEMGQKSYEFIKNDFTIDRMIRHTHQVYQSLNNAN